MIVCIKCKKEKLSEEFSRSSKRKNGRQAICKLCTKEYNIFNKEKIALQKSIFYIENKEEIKFGSSIIKIL
jgi:hypothetical protein